MKRPIFSLFALFLLPVLILCGCGPVLPPEETGAAETPAGETEPPAPREVRIHSISELNTKSERDSHAGETSFATVESNFREYFEIKPSDFGLETLFYPRLKLLPNGRYILFFQDGVVGPNVYYALSDDGVHFGEARSFFKSKSSNDSMYATCEALVLQNGDLLTVTSYRNPTNYLAYPGNCGLLCRISHDNGETFTAAKRIFVGCNWEPGLCQLASGEVQVYFTNTYGRKTSEGLLSSTGTAILRSYDNGVTWNGSTARTYSGQIVSQSKTENVGGVQMFSEQMPVPVALHNGKLALALEVRLDRKSNFRISVSYSDDNWAKALTVFEDEGPETKLNRFTIGAGPYLRQFESGETLLVYNRKNKLTGRVGDENAANFRGEVVPFSSGKATNHWADLEIVSSHAVRTANDVRTDNEKDPNPLIFGTLYLDHRVTADRFAVTADGDNLEWEGHDEALFVGSATQAQEALRFAHEDGYFSVLCERLDWAPAAEDTTTLYIAPTGENDRYLIVRFGADGVQSAVYKDGKNTETFDPAGIAFGSFVRAPEGEKDPEAGYLAELKIPISYLPGLEGECRVGFLMDAKEDGRASRDLPDGLTLSDVSTWFRVVLG
ncbi:MAG: exo-alpha-sialidase [Clostridia bacterium]|nr:exo-alpha-sialidase [Clostridia bacterium]